MENGKLGDSCDNSFGVGGGGDRPTSAGRDGMVFCKSSQSFRDAMALEVLTFFQVVAGVVGCRPMSDGIDVQLNLLTGLRIADQHLARWDESGNQFEFGIV